ncbi:MAG: hypothetical protein EOM26_07695 [Alphaproteobacteria bacterium]|nr:hypothetical protein [Alphaproteobacteria bacterium]
MTSVTHLATRVQVMSVRCAGYAMVVPINRDGSLTRRKGTLTVRFPRDTHRLVVEGSVWDVAGPERCTSFAVRGYIRYETLIDAQRVTYVRPSGLILARWIAANVPGIGSVIANRLVRQRKLDHWVANNDLDALTSKAAISEKQARNLVAHWPAKGLYDAIEWLQERNLPAGLADPLIGLWKDRTVETLEKNPFLLRPGLLFDRLHQRHDRCSASV